MKAVHGHYCTCKAYNGRVMLEWLADVSREVSRSNTTDDPRIPLQAAALILAEYIFEDVPLVLEF